MASATLLAGSPQAGSRAAFALHLAMLCVCCVFAIPSEARAPSCPTGFVNFGDSHTDTGNIVDAFPFALKIENLPYGESYFGKPAKRSSNGRLVVDFFSLAFHYPLLDPWFKVTSYQYKNGINFAEAGATATPRVSQGSPFSFSPFQLSQFRRFIGGVTAIKGNPAKRGEFSEFLPSGDTYLGDWLYTIEIGVNDILGLGPNVTTPEGIQQAISTIVPEVVAAIASGIQQLHVIGARNFLIFGIITPECGKCRDAIVTAFNAQMLDAIRVLRATLNETHIAFFDYYAAFLEITKNSAKYGFTSLPPKSCCGSYNFTTTTCGSPGIDGCANPEEYVFWDGIHFTEHFYREISKFALAGKFTDGGISYTDLCNLDFSEFGPTATYRRTYPSACDTF